MYIFRVKKDSSIMKDIDHFGFNLEWVHPVSTLFSHEYLDKLYQKYYLNFKEFIVALNLDDDLEKKCLTAERKCITCKNNYPYTRDPFVHIYLENRDITCELCHDCISRVISCSRCKKVSDLIEPWQKIYCERDVILCSSCKFTPS